MHFAYILYSPSKNKYYMGSCQDIEDRIRKHNTNHAGFTGKTGDWILKWIEEHPDKTSALKTRKTNKELEKPRFDRKTYWSLDRLVLSIPILHREGHWFEPSNSHITKSLIEILGFFVKNLTTMHFAYILYSPSKNKYYIGSCRDIEDRIRKHNTNHAGFTGKTGDWILKWIEEHPDKTSALKREKQLKNWKSRVLIEKLIGV